MLFLGFSSSCHFLSQYFSIASNSRVAVAQIPHVWTPVAHHVSSPAIAVADTNADAGSLSSFVNPSPHASPRAQPPFNHRIPTPSELATRFIFSTPSFCFLLDSLYCGASICSTIPFYTHIKRAAPHRSALRNPQPATAPHRPTEGIAGID